MIGILKRLLSQHSVGYEITIWPGGVMTKRKILER
jgi:hypothetical protein